MAALTLFGVSLVTVHSVVEAGVLLGTGVASAALAWNLLKARVGRAGHPRAGAVAAAVTAAVGLWGLRLESQAMTLDSPTLGPWLVVSGLVASAAWLAFSLTAALVARPAPPPQEDVELAVSGLVALRRSVQRLRTAREEAETRQRAAEDRAVQEEFAQTVKEIARRQVLGQEVLESATGAVLRQVCKRELRLLMEARPDDVVARLAAPGTRSLEPARVRAARDAVGVFLARSQAVRDSLVRERDAAAGSVAARVARPAQAEAGPVLEAVEEVRACYGRVRDRLDALRLRLEAAAETRSAVQVAESLAQGPAHAGAGPEVLAAEISGSEEASRRALLLAHDESAPVVQALARAEAAFNQDDEERLRDVLRGLQDALVPQR